MLVCHFYISFYSAAFGFRKHLESMALHYNITFRNCLLLQPILLSSLLFGAECVSSVLDLLMDNISNLSLHWQHCCLHYKLNQNNFLWLCVCVCLSVVVQIDRASGGSTLAACLVRNNWIWLGFVDTITNWLLNYPPQFLCQFLPT